MKKHVFEIPIFDFSLTVIDDVQSSDMPELQDILETFGTPEEEVQYYVDMVENDCYDGAWFIYDKSAHAGIILMLRQSSLEQRISTLMHEKRHVEDRVLELYNINDIETAALLAGYLGRILLTKVL